MIGWIVRLNGVLIGLCVVILIISRIVHPPDVLETLDLNDCCYQAIRPGVTSWDEAKAHYPAAPRTIENDVEVITMGGFRVISNPARTLVVSVEGTINASLGTIIAHFGRPCSIDYGFYGESNYAMQLQYPTLSVTLSLLNTRRLNPQARATFLILGSDHYVVSTHYKVPNRCDGSLQWRGLTSMPHLLSGVNR